MNLFSKKQAVYIIANNFGSYSNIFWKNNHLPKVSIVPTNIPTPTSFVGYKQTVFVTRVIDGDTIEIEGKIKVRYIGTKSLRNLS